jgi:DNA-binding SARP family transcriptional activator
MLELRISLLGTSRLAWGLAGPPIHVTGPARTLMSFLVLNRNRTHRRERLAELLWGDVDEDRARRCLNTALWRLRKALTPERETPRRVLLPVLTTTGGEVGFNTAAPHWLDVAVFEDAARAVLGADPGSAPPAAVARFEAALALYGGELLEDCDADWVLPERQRLTEFYLAGLQWLTLHHERAGAPDKAIESAVRLLHVDPLREDAHRQLIGLYCATGQRRKALKQYDYCRDVLASELGVTPAPETEIFCRRLLAGGGSGGEERAPAPTVAAAAAVTAGAGASDPRRLLAEALERLGEAMRALEAAQRLVEAADRRSPPRRGERP